MQALIRNKYLSKYREKYLSKRSLIKHTCSWRDKLIMNTEQTSKIIFT